jgi:hypothetical protein
VQLVLFGEIDHITEVPDIEENSSKIVNSKWPSLQEKSIIFMLATIL